MKNNFYQNWKHRSVEFREGLPKLITHERPVHIEHDNLWFCFGRLHIYARMITRNARVIRNFQTIFPPFTNPQQTRLRSSNAAHQPHNITSFLSIEWKWRFFIPFQHSREPRNVPFYITFTRRNDALFPHDCERSVFNRLPISFKSTINLLIKSIILFQLCRVHYKTSIYITVAAPGGP